MGCPGSRRMEFNPLALPWNIALAHPAISSNPCFVSRLLCTSKSLYTARGKLWERSVAVEYAPRNALQADQQQFLGWLSQHAAIVKTLRLSLPHFHPTSTEAEAMLALINAAQAAVPRGLQLDIKCDLGHDGTILQQLPAAHISSLDIQQSRPLDNTASIIIRDSLVSMTALRCLKLSNYHDDGYMEQLLQPLSALTQLRDVFLCPVTPQQIQHLPAQLQTACLVLGEPHQQPISPVAAAAAAAAVAEQLQKFTALRSLRLHAHTTLHDDGPMLQLPLQQLGSGLTVLTALKDLELFQVRVSQLRQLPSSLLCLQATLHGKPNPGDLQLGQLTALTELCLNSFASSWGPQAGDVLPASLVVLNLPNCRSAAPLLHLSRLQRLALRRCSTPVGQLQLLKDSLSQLQELQLTYEAGQDGADFAVGFENLQVAGAEAAAAAAAAEAAAVADVPWCGLPVQQLKLCSYSSNGRSKWRVSDTLLQQVARLHSLTSLAMHDCCLTNTTPRQLAGVLGQLTNLRSLELKRPVLARAQTGMVALAGAIASLPLLDSLVLDAPTVNLHAAAGQLTHAVQLTRLELEGDGLQDSSVAALAINLTGLQVLALGAAAGNSSNGRITDAVVPVIARQLPQLTELRLWRTGATILGRMALACLYKLRVTHSDKLSGLSLLVMEWTFCNVSGIPYRQHDNAAFIAGVQAKRQEGGISAHRRDRVTGDPIGDHPFVVCAAAAFDTKRTKKGDGHGALGGYFVTGLKPGGGRPRATVEQLAVLSYQLKRLMDNPVHWIDQGSYNVPVQQQILGTAVEVIQLRHELAARPSTAIQVIDQGLDYYITDEARALHERIYGVAQ